MDNEFEDRRVVVTGGSKGIGRGIASAFASAGAKVLITGRDAGAVADAQDDMTARGQHVVGLVADASSGEDTKRMIAEAEATLGGVDILCCNAGVFPESRLESMTSDDIDTVLNINLRGTMLAVIEALPALKRSERGRVIVVSSITGNLTGVGGWSHYGASKAGQMGFVRTAALELAPYGVTVNALLPGNVLTEGVRDLGPEYERDMAASIPLGRLANEHDIGQIACFLASDAASYITGQGLVIDGGQVLPESLVGVGAG